MKPIYLLVFSLCLTTFAWATKPVSNDPVRNAHRVISSALEDNSANLDSICYFDSDSVLFQKYIYTYDASGNKLSELILKSSNGVLMNDSKKEYIYDASGNILSELVLKGINGVMGNESKKEYFYDIDGNLINENRYKWNSNQWQLNYTDTSVYYNGKKMSYVVYQFNENVWIGNSSEGDPIFGDVWIGTTKREFIYSISAEGETLTTKSYNWTYPNGPWTLSNKWESSYDSYGKCTLEVGYQLQEGNWTSSGKTEYFYDDSSRDTARYSYVWDFNSQVWEYKDKYIATYNEQGYYLTQMEYIWNIDHWTPYFTKYEFTYDGNSYTEIIYDGYPIVESESWVPRHKYDYLLDEEGRTTSYTCFDWNGASWSEFMKYEYVYEECGNYYVIYYNWVNGQWVVSSSVYYYYASSSTDIISTTDSSVTMHKFIRNCAIVIEKNGIFYDIMGNVVKR